MDRLTHASHSVGQYPPGGGGSLVRGGRAASQYLPGGGGSLVRGGRAARQYPSSLGGGPSSVGYSKVLTFYCLAVG